ncbi:endonuclease [Shewanella goraebulensis]|uniref:endonuclease n=1 Tax=Shewanella goraebulensis TaxID=3050637 RepID=UPI00254FD149|nr:endonuclease [Shewanella goraebulensis]
MNNKISTLAKAASLLLATASTAANADLVITEYVEGGGNNKAVEISNLGANSVDLDAAQYVLALYSNGGTDAGNSETLTGTLAAGSSIVFHNASADDLFKVGIESTVTYFNGDDALVLTKDNVVIDRFGKLGEDPGSEWTDPNDANFSTKDKTLRRKASITTGETDAAADFPGTDNQWVVFDKDTGDGLGCPGEGTCTVEPGVLLITEYIEGSSSNKAVELSNVGGSTLDLDANTYTLTMFSNGSSEIQDDRTETLSGSLAPGETIVFHNSSAWDEFKVGTESSVTWFNGDDALVLYKDGIVIDRFGVLGEDPGSEWLDANDPDFSTKDKTLRRKNNVVVGDTVATAPFPGDDNQWAVFDKDTSDGLGCSGEEACPEIPVCENCPDLDPVADPDAYNRDEYYSDVINGSFDTPEAMKQAISVVIADGHQQLSYSEVWTVVTHSDEDPSDSMNVLELYTGNSIAKNSNAGNGGSWNREHVWAKSHGFPSESQLGYTDAHHLRPTNDRVNSTRSNYDFDECSDTGVELETAPGNYLDTEKRCFEPRDAVKGDVARMIMYMDTRYQGNDSNMPDLVAVDYITTAEEVSANAPLIGKLCTMYNWHQQDPVSEADIQRNNAVYTYQGNRNPYIDNPEWVQAVYGEACGPKLDVDFIITAPEMVNETDAFVLDASATVAEEGTELSFIWEQTSGPELTFDATSAVLSLTAPEVTADTALEFVLTVSDGSLEATQTVAVTVVNVPLSFDISFSGNTELAQGEATVITASIADEPEGLTYSWSQTSGQTADYSASGLVLNLTAPEVSVDQALVFQLVVTDGEEQFVSSVSVNVKNETESGWTKPDGAGSLGGGLLMLLPLVWRRRMGRVNS